MSLYYDKNLERKRSLRIVTSFYVYIAGVHKFSNAPVVCFLVGLIRSSN
jgi:hypothetical protein